jgi:hypothetical protein
MVVCRERCSKGSELLDLGNWDVSGIHFVPSCFSNHHVLVVSICVGDFVDMWGHGVWHVLCHSIVELVLTCFRVLEFFGDHRPVEFVADAVAPTASFGWRVLRLWFRLGFHC